VKGASGTLGVEDHCRRFRHNIWHAWRWGSLQKISAQHLVRLAFRIIAEDFGTTSVTLGVEDHCRRFRHNIWHAWRWGSLQKISAQHLKRRLASGGSKLCQVSWKLGSWFKVERVETVGQHGGLRNIPYRKK